MFIKNIRIMIFIEDYYIILYSNLIIIIIYIYIYIYIYSQVIYGSPLVMIMYVYRHMFAINYHICIRRLAHTHTHIHVYTIDIKKINFLYIDGIHAFMYNGT